MNTEKLFSYETQLQFHKYFGINIKMFLHRIFGFDIIKFDKHMNVPDGTSLKEFIEQKYSKEASEFVESLIRL